MKTQLSEALRTTLPSMTSIGTQGRPIDSANWRRARYASVGTSENPMSRKNGFTAASTSGGWRNHSRRPPMKRIRATPIAPATSARASPCRRNSPASSWRPAPLALDANTATGVSRPTPTMKKMLKTPTPNDEAARGTAPVRPIITLSVIPMSTWLTWPMVMGIARSSVARDSLKTACIDEVYRRPAGEVQRYLCRNGAGSPGTPPNGGGRAPLARPADPDRVPLRLRVGGGEAHDLGRVPGELERLPGALGADRRPLVVQEIALNLHPRRLAAAVLDVGDHLEPPVPEGALLQARALDGGIGRRVERGEAVRVLDCVFRRVAGRLGVGRGRAPGKRHEAAKRGHKGEGMPGGHGCVRCPVGMG